jgi:hypothetical protein
VVAVLVLMRRQPMAVKAAQA